MQIYIFLFYILTLYMIEATHPQIFEHHFQGSRRGNLPAARLPGLQSLGLAWGLLLWKLSLLQVDDSAGWVFLSQMGRLAQ
jgi:hypothetical protein